MQSNPVTIAPGTDFAPIVRPMPLRHRLGSHLRWIAGVASVVNSDDVVVIGLPGLNLLIRESCLRIAGWSQLRPLVFRKIRIGRPIKDISGKVRFRVCWICPLSVYRSVSFERQVDEAD